MPCEDELPAWYADPAGLVLSGVVSRSTAGTVLPELLQRDVREQFRNQDGASYAPWSWYEAVDHDNALVVVGADITREAYPTLAKRATKLVRWLSDDGPSADHLREQVESRVQAMNDPYNAVGVAGRAAHEHLRGRPATGHDQLVEELEAITVDDVRDVASEFRRTLMLGVPGDSPAPQGMAQLTQPSNRGWVSGRRFRHRDWPAVKTYLVVDVADAHLVAEPDHQCYHADEVEGLHKFDDGGRHLVTSDGWGLTVHPEDWRGGSTLVAALDAMVPEDRHLPMPAREGVDSGRQMALLRRLWAARKTPNGPITLAVAGVVLALVGVVIIAFGRFLIGGFWLIWAGITAKEAVVRWRRRVYRGLGDSAGLPPPRPGGR